MEITSLCKVFKDVCIQSHESPKKDGNLLIEWDNVQTLWQIRSIGVNDILEVFGKPIVQWIKVHSAMNNSEQSKEFI